MTTLTIGDTFQMHGLHCTVEAVDGADYTVSARYERQYVGLRTYNRGFIAHQIAEGRATLNPVLRCQICGEPDSGEMAEAVFGDRHLIGHVGCVEAKAQRCGLTLDAVLA